MPVKHLLTFLYATCFLLGLPLVFTGCTGGGDSDSLAELKKLIRDSYRQDSVIDAAEWQKILARVKLNPLDFPELAPNGKVDCEALKKFTAGLSQKPITISAPCETAAAPAVKVFLENSQSMDGYVKGQTDFEANLVRLLADLGNVYQRDSIHIHFLDSYDVHPYPLPKGDFTNSVSQFVKSLEAASGSPWESSGGPSELNQILNKMLLNTGPNNLSVLISDFIHSPGEGASPTDGLSSAQSVTYSAFLSKAKTLATLVWQLKSQFHGSYWTMETKPGMKPKPYWGTRPYFIWFVGSPELVRQVMDKLNAGNYKGYQNRLAFFPSAGAAVEPFARVVVLSELGKEGDFQPDVSNPLMLKNVNPALGAIQFSLAVDLSQVPADESYRMDANNYQASSGFRVTKVDKITDDLLSKFSSNEGNSAKIKLKSSSATHLLTLRAERNFPKETVTIRLNDQLPAWVAASHTENDAAGPDADHTFGLKYLIEGVSQAYKPSGEAPALARFTVKLN